MIRAGQIASGSLLACAVAVVIAACGSDTPTTPTTVDPIPTTESFSSTVQRNGATTRSFSTSAQGVITVRLTSLTVDAISMGLGLGLSDAATGKCLATYTVTTSLYTGRAISVTADAGTYCIIVYDVGELGNQTNFTVSVTHF